MPLAQKVELLVPNSITLTDSLLVSPKDNLDPELARNMVAVSCASLQAKAKALMDDSQFPAFP
jgi:hypothetical protein